MTALLVSVLGCTTAAQIHGPRLGFGVELDNDLRFSPRVEVGYDFMYWKSWYGGGVSGGLSYAPVTERASLYVEGLGSIPFIPLNALAIGGELTLKRDTFGFGLRGGISTLAFYPPDACTGDEGPCPPGEWTTDDVVHPNWLPRFDFRVVGYFGLEREECGSHDCAYAAYLLQFSSVLATYYLADAEP